MSEPTAALRALVGSVQLLAVGFHEISARQADGIEAKLEENPNVVPEYALGIFRDDQDASRFKLRLRCRIVFSDGSELIAEPEGTYQVTDESLLPLSRELIVEFANEVAVMALLPYLRQALADMSQRVFGSTLLMPVMQRGVISFVANQDPASQAETTS